MEIKKLTTALEKSKIITNVVNHCISIKINPKGSWARTKIYFNLSYHKSITTTGRLTFALVRILKSISSFLFVILCTAKKLWSFGAFFVFYWPNEFHPD